MMTKKKMMMDKMMDKKKDDKMDKGLPPMKAKKMQKAMKGKKAMKDYPEMPVPYTFISNFEDGLIQWTTETDDDGKLDVAHYTALYASPWHELPYRGAYALRLDLGVSTTEATLGNAIVVAQGATVAARFYVYAQDLVMAVNNRLTLFSLESAGAVPELVVDLRNAAGVIEILAAETGAAATVASAPLAMNQWHLVELVATLDSGAADGTATFFLDGVTVGTIPTLTQAALATMRLGVIGQDAGTTAGRLLFDEVVVDDVRIYGLAPRFSTASHYARTSHVALGPGQLEDVYLRDSGSFDATCDLYDTDIASLGARRILTLNGSSSVRNGDEGLSVGTFAHGVYAVLAGTGPELVVTLRHGVQSVGGVQHLAATRR